MSRLLLPLVLFLAVSYAIPFSDENEAGIEKIQIKSDETKIIYRLPEDIKPINYNILLTPRLDNDFTYTGKSVIKVKVIRRTSKITLHSLDLDYPSKEAIVNVKDGIQNFHAKIELVPKSQFLIIDLTESPLNSNAEAEITLEYSGKLRDDLTGFYKSSYTNDKGEKRWLGTTQFEPIYARRAFPCFDEPALKATFDISIDLKDLKEPTKYKVISNMPGTIPESTKTITKFETTPKMSTYLVAFVISDFESKGDEKMKVWTRKDLQGNVDYALNVGKEILKGMEDYVGVPYQLKKMDQVGIPDFAAGAMENWGIVTYRENALVYNDKTSSASKKQSVAGIIAHEFAHQWFGNHVGPEWWKYVWLNEGFATFFQYFIPNESFEMRNQFVVEALQGAAFTFDVTNQTHPMNAEVESPAEIKKLFDAISYRKAGSIIRMMQHIMTDENFKKGLKVYLNDKQNDKANSDDLLSLLGENYKDKDLKKIMDSWINQPGYPVITVKRDYKKKKVEVVQQRFLMKPSKEESKEKWTIPINFASESKADDDFKKTDVTQWLDSNVKNLEFNLDVNSTEWVIFNKQQIGYYRVNYDTQNWKLIVKFLKSKNFTKIHKLNRAQLVDDAWNLAQANHLNYEIAFDLMKYLKEEVDYFPWYSAIRSLTFLKNHLISTSHYESFKTFSLNLVEKLVEDVGFVDKDDDNHIMKLKRNLALKWACGLGFKNCTTQYKKVFDSWLEDPIKNAISPNIKDIVLCTGLKSANQSEWNKVYDFYLKSKDQSEKEFILASLGCSTNETILENYLNLAIEKDSKIKSTTLVFKAVYNGNEIGVGVCLEYISTQVTAILRSDKGDFANLLMYVKEIGGKISNEEQLKTLNKFIEMHKPLQGEETKLAIEQAKENIEWINKTSAVIGGILDAKPEPDGASSLHFAAILTLIPVFLALFI